MKVEIKKDELVKYLVKQLALDGLKKAGKNLKEIDWNPFDDDGDEYETAWEEIKHNKDLLVEAAMCFVDTAERLVIEGNKLTSQQKHDAVVGALDKAICLPFFVEPFDGKIISLLVTSVVKMMKVVRRSVGVPVESEPQYIAGSPNPKFGKALALAEPAGIDVTLTKKGIFKEVG